MRIVSFPEVDVPPALRAQVLTLQRQAWPGDEPAEPAQTHDPALQPLSLLLIEGARVLSALDILSKDITHQGRRYAASGLSTVVTDEGLRGKGHGRRLVEAAHDMLVKSDRDLGIFTCDRPLQA